MKKIVRILLITFSVFVILFLFRDYLLILGIKIFYEKSYQGDKLPFPKISQLYQAELSDYIYNNYESPEDYVISKFESHDIVFIDENHRIKHDVELIQSLIPILYENGIYNLGMEFACHKDQKLIDSLIFSTEYNQNLANRILFQGNVLWGYQEYSDIFKQAWALNKNLSREERKFRVFGLDAPQNNVDDRDEQMADVVERAFINTNKKALIYCGIHHAFTDYKQPFFRTTGIHLSDTRLGNRIHRLIADRTFTIFLHCPWGVGGEEAYYNSNAKYYPVNGIIDTLMKTIPQKYKRVGFDTKGSPFGSLSCENCVYKYGYDNFTLQDFCDGYIYQKPLSEYEGVRSIDNFINKQNIAEARTLFPDNSYKFLFDNFGTVFWNYAVSMDADLKHMHKYDRYK